MGVFAKKENETFQEYRDRAIDKLSPSFCGAKWYNATIWLGNGTTTSCHHPPAHKIPLDELKFSYKALHNTTYKKAVRKQMMEGVRPKECEYCWKIEDLGKDKVSDRVYKSVIYTDEELKDAKETMGYTEDVDLKTLEIAFDANCNFGCSYCNASFSTTWQKDIKMNGAYQNLVSDGAGAFQHDGAHAMPYGRKNKDNPYIEAFWKWWEAELQFSLRELRVTGGEPSMSPDFWKLMDWWKKNPDCEVPFAVNSNLGQKKALLDALIDVSHSFKDFTIYTSNEAVGLQAEYIRFGLEWDVWLKNMYRVNEEANIKSVNVMMTINALCLFSITEFLDEMLKLKAKFGGQAAVLSFNILRFPSFQSIVTLPPDIRKERAEHIEAWLDKNWDEGKNGFMDYERDGLLRLIDYIKKVETGHEFTSSLESRERDWKSFYTQYDIRRKKDFREAFPSLVEWYDSIPETNLGRLKELVDGDDAKSNRYVEGVLKQAKDEGWILNPQWANPGSQEYVEPDDQQQDDMIDLIGQLNKDQDTKFVGGIAGKKTI
jgi:organic radical activating enzyme